MSIRNFERKFIDEVGMSPKLYSRITRFFYTVENKMMYPQRKWTSIAHDSGYFDQAHFIRECKEFSSRTPEELFMVTPPPPEKFVGKVER
jgi:AraC-like DNA-binding protein